MASFYLEYNLSMTLELDNLHFSMQGTVWISLLTYKSMKRSEKLVFKPIMAFMLLV